MEHYICGMIVTEIMRCSWFLPAFYTFGVLVKAPPNLDFPKFDYTKISSPINWNPLILECLVRCLRTFGGCILLFIYEWLGNEDWEESVFIRIEHVFWIYTPVVVVSPSRHDLLEICISICDICITPIKSKLYHALLHLVKNCSDCSSVLWDFEDSSFFIFRFYSRWVVCCGGGRSCRGFRLNE